MATLGISTNTRLLGMAIITQGKLVAYSIRLHKSPWSARKANMIVTGLEPCVRRYCIKKVVLSIPHAYYHTKASKVLRDRICRYFEANGIPVETASPDALATLCRPGEKKTKKALMKALVEQFPELNYYYHKELRNKNKYYTKLFEAVAAATLQQKE